MARVQGRGGKEIDDRERKKRWRSGVVWEEERDKEGERGRKGEGMRRQKEEGRKKTEEEKRR